MAVSGKFKGQFVLPDIGYCSRFKITIDACMDSAGIDRSLFRPGGKIEDHQDPLRFVGRGAQCGVNTLVLVGDDAPPRAVLVESRMRCLEFKKAGNALGGAKRRWIGGAVA